MIFDNFIRKFLGKSIIDLDDNLIVFIKYEISEYFGFIDEFLNVLNLNMKEEDFFLLLNGVINIFSYLEFNDVLKVKLFLNMLEKKEIIVDIIKLKGI